MASRDAALILVAEGGSPTMFARIGINASIEPPKTEMNRAGLTVGACAQL